MAAKLGSATLRMVPRMALMTTSELTVFPKRPSSPPRVGSPMLRAVAAACPSQKATAKNSLDPAGSQAPVCQLASGGLEDKCCTHWIALCCCVRSVSGPRGASTPLGRETEGKLSRVPRGCSDTRRQWTTAESGGAGLPEWNSAPRAHSVR